MPSIYGQMKARQRGKERQNRIHDWLFYLHVRCNFNVVDIVVFLDLIFSINWELSVWIYRNQDWTDVGLKKPKSCKFWKKCLCFIQCCTCWTRTFHSS